MNHPPHSFAIACALALGVCSARSAGVAVLKEQPYHADASARAVAYSHIIDSHGPYLRIVCGETNLDVLRTKLAARIELPGEIPASITEEKDLSPLRETLAAMSAFTTRYPKSAPFLEKPSAALAGHVSRFEGGEVRFEGAWIPRNELAAIRETRRREHEARERAEVEKRVFEATQRDKGLALHDGKWMTPQEIERTPPESPTELSAAIEPLGNADLEGARFAVKNLTTLAASQTGAPKVRTERLLTAVRNLFLAEARLSDRLIARTTEANEAALHDKNAENWLKPNAFGTINEEASGDSRDKAAEIRRRSAEQLAACRQDLLDQLREADVVTTDFHRLREHRVALILGGTVRDVAARHFTESEFRPTFPEESLASIREKIRVREKSRAR